MKAIFVRTLVIWVVAVSFFTVIVTSCGNISAKPPVKIDMKDGIHFFEGGLEKAVALAGKEHKPLFIMVHASWCAVCKRMKKEVLPQKQAGDVFNDRFISLMVDYDSTEGVIIRSQYEVKGTPTFLFLGPDGKLINRAEGYQGISSLTGFAKNIQVDGKPVCN